MFGETNQENEDGAVTFQRAIYKSLKIKLARKHIYPVYDYFDEVNNKTHYIYYACAPKIKKFTLKEETLSWFTFKQIEKLSLVKQTKQDIIVAKRVIDARDREERNVQHYPVPQV